MNNYMAIKWINWRNGRILRKVQFSKAEPGRNRNYEQPNYSTEIEAVIKNLPQKTKAQDQMVSQENSIKHLEKS